MKIFTITAKFPVSPQTIYKAWLSGPKHSAMTGGRATASSRIGGKFTAWDGYISGKNLELTENKKIVQEWRTAEFRQTSDPSIVRIELTGTKNSCTLKLTHSGIPDGQPDYKTGWAEHYINPMSAYFSK